MTGEPNVSSSYQAPMRATTVVDCPLCGSPGAVLYEHLTDRARIVEGEWRGRQCSDSECATYWLDPVPTEEDIHKAYASYYTHTNDKSDQGWGARREDFALRSIRSIGNLWLKCLFLAAEREALESMFLAGLPAGRVLEVGSGAGVLLQRLHTLGWEVEGQDVDRNAASIHNDDITVHLGELKALSLPSESYDAVVMNHVIEHVHDPVSLLRECHRIAKPGGVLVIATPNVNSYGHRIFRDVWRGLEAPRHLRVFSPTSLTNAVKSSGWLSQATFTTAARAGENLAASRDTRRTGFYQMGGRKPVSRLIFAAWYQVAARLAHLRYPGAGEEIVSIARK